MAILTKHLPHQKAMRALGLLLCLVLSTGQARAQALQLDEQKAKAGLVYNFLKYTQWNSESLPIKRERLQVCLFGYGSMTEYIRQMEGRVAQQYGISIARKSAGDDVADCSLAFIHRSEDTNLDALISALKGKNILTVSDITGFTQRGGMVELATREDKRIHLYINTRLVNEEGLRIQSRLLNLAERSTP